MRDDIILGLVSSLVFIFVGIWLIVVSSGDLLVLCLGIVVFLVGCVSFDFIFYKIVWR